MHIDIAIKSNHVQYKRYFLVTVARNIRIIVILVGIFLASHEEHVLANAIESKVTH